MMYYDQYGNPCAQSHALNCGMTVSHPTYGAVQYPQGAYTSAPQQFNGQAVTVPFLPKEVVLAWEKGAVSASLENQKHWNKMEEIAARTEGNILRDQKADERREQRKNASLVPIEEADGYIVIQKKVPGRKTTYSEPVLTWPYVRMKTVVSAQTGKSAAQLISWRGKDGDNSLILRKMTTASFVKEMTASGNTFRVGRDRRREIDDLVYSFLIAHAETIEYPDHHGWNKVNGTWTFAAENERTIESILKGEID